jgi:hypothetical protein
MQSLFISAAKCLEHNQMLMPYEKICDAEFCQNVVEVPHVSGADIYCSEYTCRLCENICHSSMMFLTFSNIPHSGICTFCWMIDTVMFMPEELQWEPTIDNIMQHEHLWQGPLTLEKLDMWPDHSKFYINRHIFPSSGRFRAPLTSMASYFTVQNYDPDTQVYTLKYKTQTLDNGSKVVYVLSVWYECEHLYVKVLDCRFEEYGSPAHYTESHEPLMMARLLRVPSVDAKLFTCECRETISADVYSDCEHCKAPVTTLKLDGTWKYVQSWEFWYDDVVYKPLDTVQDGPLGTYRMHL